MVFAGQDEILSRFEALERQTNHSLMMNAEEYCFPKLDGVCDNYPPSPHRWWYLNCGLIIGRVYALKSLLQMPVPDVIEGSDQMWYQQRFRAEPSSILLDTNCTLLCAITGDTMEKGIAFRDNRIHAVDSGTTPLLVHFVSLAHWPLWRGGQPTSSIHEIFRQIYPEEATRLLESWRVEVTAGAVHQHVLYDGQGWFGSMRSFFCIHCCMMGSTHKECESFPSLFDTQCLPTLLLCGVLGGLIILMLFVIAWRCHAKNFRLLRYFLDFGGMSTTMDTHSSELKTA